MPSRSSSLLSSPRTAPPSRTRSPQSRATLTWTFKPVNGPNTAPFGPATFLVQRAAATSTRSSSAPLHARVRPSSEAMLYDLTPNNQQITAFVNGVQVFQGTFAPDPQQEQQPDRHRLRFGAHPFNPTGETGHRLADERWLAPRVFQRRDEYRSTDRSPRTTKRMAYGVRSPRTPRSSRASTASFFEGQLFPVYNSKNLSNVAERPEEIPWDRHGRRTG